MSVVLGTNAGFVTTAPVADPTGALLTLDNAARSLKHTTPAGTSKIVKVGWYHSGTSTAGDYEIGLYAHNEGTDKPAALLYSTTPVTSGTTEGWKTQVVDWAVNPSTIYWLAVQLDAVSGDSKIDYESSGGRSSIDVGINTLQNPWVDDAMYSYILALYGEVEVSGGGILVPTAIYKHLLQGE